MAARVVTAQRPVAGSVQATQTGAVALADADAEMQAQCGDGKPTVARMDAVQRATVSQGEKERLDGLDGGGNAAAPAHAAETAGGAPGGPGQ
eukprot:690609-Lingulodinium_polyedra.AAC.1